MGHWFHRLVFGFGLAAVAVLFYVFDDWWGLIAALLLAVPAGFGFTILAPMLIGTVRRTPLGNDFLMTWLSFLGGSALIGYGVFELSGPVRAIIVLCGAALVLAGIAVLEAAAARDGLRPADGDENVGLKRRSG